MLSQVSSDFIQILSLPHKPSGFGPPQTLYENSFLFSAVVCHSYINGFFFFKKKMPWVLHF